ncbi:toll/interleukin-1 receptor domain-containing protein [Lacihabitans sp. LS3-19]|uniref:toll/interleukin-1 receptor domain-containing protein n=1 Tax=Lacihabitans sp. LS3-19 TaxID=2487335 RepID=UPI0020CE2E97|nr:toll/interleukin-1 receptor domain-containing protein [Lacihabitans sp. LS3-19]MCP9767912.1 toll/interleukin-1 receptor domain-containing protein [Lacihabitans sp. LS3-19]
MRYRYQLIILGTTGQLSDEIISLFSDTVKDLQMLQDAFTTITEHNFSKDYTGKQPAFAIYFGDKEGSFTNLDIVDRLITDGTSILPVFYNSFSKEIPKSLENQNGLLYDSTKNAKIVNLALESFGKLRNTRKVFISYKRDESSSVAIQLFEALEKNNFDVFLDTHSIKQGEPFQQELWHRMADCDVIVLLNTPGFLTSRWCKEEIAEASATQIGVIHLIWPNHKLENTSEVCFPILLKELDFEPNTFINKDISKLVSGIVNQIVEEVESVRARNLAARQDNLITEFISIAQKHKKTLNLQPERFITEDLDNDTRRIFFPLVGIPQSIDCNQSANLKHEITEFNVEEVYLIYDDVRIREKWVKHLDWLNEYLVVKTIKKQEFDKWLQMN